MLKINAIICATIFLIQGATKWMLQTQFLDSVQPWKKKNGATRCSKPNKSNIYCIYKWINPMLDEKDGATKCPKQCIYECFILKKNGVIRCSKPNNKLHSKVWNKCLLKMTVIQSAQNHISMCATMCFINK